MNDSKDASSFDSLQDEAEDLQSTITALGPHFGIDFEPIDAVQTTCTGATAGDTERVDVSSVVEIDDPPADDAFEAAQADLEARGWETERATSAASTDLFATRGDATLTVSLFHQPTRLSASGRTACRNP